MSYTFSRREFLKYSAATAVAMAGAGLLGGCEYQDPNNPVSKKLNSYLDSALQLRAGLRDMKIDHGTCTLTVDIQSARENPFKLDPSCFSVSVIGVDVDADGKTKTFQRYFSMNNNNRGVKFLNATSILISKKNPKVEGLQMVATEFPDLQDGDTVLFQYIPESTMSNYSLNWEITKEVYDAHNKPSSGSSGVPEPGASTTT